jgi:transposase
LIGMEACATAHYWAQELMALGHEVRLIPPHYVSPMFAGTSPTRRMRRRSARQLVDRRCASCR